MAGCAGGDSSPTPAYAKPASLTVAGLLPGLPEPSNTSQPSGGNNVETPLAADALADSVGLNSQTPLLYTQADFTTIVSAEKALGVRHLREGILNGMAPYDAALSSVLNATNASVDGIGDCAGLASNSAAPTSAASIQQFNAAIGNRLESVEGPNEPDLRGDPKWVADTIACLPGLRSATHLPFVGPALGDPTDDASSLGDIAPLVDEGNLHRYYAGRNPGTPGWGGTSSCGVYGALPWALCLSRENTQSKPIVVTETGYNSQTEVDETTQAKYLTRAFLVDLQAGVARSYVYDIKDNPADGSFSGNGLLRSDDSQKPAFTAIENEISYFTDRTTHVAVPLTYSLKNTSLDHQLFQKSDGTYILALWNETASWNVVTNSPNVVVPQSQTVLLGRVPSSVSAVAFTDTGSLVPAATTTAGADITLPVDDHVSLVSFKF
jgi:hypothetical protein